MTNGSPSANIPRETWTYYNTKKGTAQHVRTACSIFQPGKFVALSSISPADCCLHTWCSVLFEEICCNGFWWIMDGWLTGRGRVTVSRLPLVEPRGPLGWWLCGTWYAEALWSTMLHALTQRSPTFFGPQTSFYGGINMWYLIDIIIIVHVVSHRKK